MKTLKYLLISTLCMLVASCGSQRRAVSPEELSAAPVEQRFDAMVASYKPWHTISMPVRVELKSPSKVSLSGRAYMVNESLIHISMRVLGFEVAVMHVTPDSVYCVDKIHKLAVIESIDRLSASTGITLGQLQSLMLGRAIVPGEGAKLSRKSKNVKLTSHGGGSDGWTMTTSAKGGHPFECVFNVEGDNNQISSIAVSVPGHKTVSCDYNDWSACEIGQIPQSLSCDLTASSKHINAVLKYTPSQVRIDAGDMPSFKRPGNGYRVISAVDLFKSLSSSSLF